MLDMMKSIVVSILMVAVACSADEPLTKAEAAMLVGEAYCSDAQEDDRYSCAWSVAQRLCGNETYCMQPVDEQGLDECLSQMQVKTLPRVCYRLF